jgi:hypothetical protein
MTLSTAGNDAESMLHNSDKLSFRAELVSKGRKERFPAFRKAISHASRAQAYSLGKWRV